ncbi:DUF6243 family protein [Streptomyces sp. SPB074]|uniref:DUF6243 family protein n=1 Tax=Streptomyces sp. (strain SPB074) TaxID=465543 RepID=UPI00017F2439|nr:DUF6243 family protein [Streptomyces sp. SPB074]EDY44571.1 hypothetical protein SSBG_02533 [Streptomyces sp. SPB074]
MAKSRNNLLGVGGQRGHLPRNGGPGSGGPHGAGDRQAAGNRKQELARRMRERLTGTEQEPGTEASEAGTDTSGGGTEPSGPEARTEQGAAEPRA